MTLLLRATASLLVGLTLGTVAAYVTNRLFYGQPRGGSGSMAAFVQSWGVVVGGIIAIAVAGLLLRLRLQPRARRVAHMTSALLLGVLGSANVYWILWWHVPPFTLEGAWQYPLAILLLLMAASLARRARNTVRGDRGHESADASTLRHRS